MAVNFVRDYKTEHKRYPDTIVFDRKSMILFLQESSDDMRVGDIKIGDEACTVELEVNNKWRTYNIAILEG
jgi:hypothetical protein